MLNNYLLWTTELLQNPAAPTPLYGTAALTDYINRARLQVAGEAQCIRDYSTLSFAASQQSAPFSAIVPSSTAIQGILNVRMVLFQVASGAVFIKPRPWEWFVTYQLNNPVPQTGTPFEWTQQGQGANGTFWVAPSPTNATTFNLDTVCFPVDLVTDATPEAIPTPWTAAVPFLAAYYALNSAQTGVRYQDAQRMDQEYSKFMQRARSMVTPNANPFIYQQSPDPTTGNKLNIQPRGDQ